MAKESERVTKPAEEGVAREEALGDESEPMARPGLREIFRQAFEKARRDHPRPTNRRELGRDRSRSLFLLVGAAIAVLLLFLGVFSSPNAVKKPTEARKPGTPGLGRKVTPGEKAAGEAGSVTPLLSADTRKPEDSSGQDVTPQDVNRTARPTQHSAGTAQAPKTTPAMKNPGPYALGRVDFSDPSLNRASVNGAVPQQESARALATDLHGSEDLKKPSLVFVRNAQSSSVSSGAKPAPAELQDRPIITELAPGTRLIARLQSTVSSAIATPVVAAIEYNYERDGEIVVPAGARALGSLQQADRSGYVAIRFDTLEMPDGMTQKIDAMAMSLAYGPLKGNVSGKKTGTRFLVRTFTGLGTVATYLVGAGGSNGFNGPLSESALLRDRMATNIGTAGDQELNRLAFNQNIVVTVPGNTRFYIVVQKGTASGWAPSGPPSLATRQVNSMRLPSVEELRQLMQLRRELSEMYQQSTPQNAGQQLPQQ